MNQKELFISALSVDLSSYEGLNVIQSKCKNYKIKPVCLILGFEAAKKLAVELSNYNKEIKVDINSFPTDGMMVMSLPTYKDKEEKLIKCSECAILEEDGNVDIFTIYES